MSIFQLFSNRIRNKQYKQNKKCKVNKTKEKSFCANSPIEKLTFFLFQFEAIKQTKTSAHVCSHNFKNTGSLTLLDLPPSK